MNTILFDLDGTLTDPKVGITNAAATALRAFGIEEDPDDLTFFIGPPLDETFREHYGFTDAQAAEAIAEFRKYFSQRGWLENVPYPGIETLLQSLVDAGKHLIVASSKTDKFVVQIMEHFGLAKYFDVICGSPMNDPKGAKKAAVIRTALARAGTADLSGIIMVGDRRHDIEGAHEVGIPAVGVLYGYGDRAEHEACGADYVAENLKELQKILLKIEL